jgi:hypothetical protein
MRTEQFDDLRPYYDEEIPAAMQRIAASPHFPFLSSFAYPGKDTEEVKRMICSYTSISEFQLQVMKAVNEQIIARSITRFTYDGISGLERETPYLFVSNHRDIMLDSSLLQYALYCSGFPTTEITFGSNLMSSQLVIDIGKANKMFKVVRGGSGNVKDFYAHSLHLSEYIRYTLRDKQQSIWIAQRNGRTKDGLDTTDQGIIKLFYMSSPADPVTALLDLHIVPVSISYEWEPCDLLKALELYHLRREGSYTKRSGEDLHSVLTGILQPKGEVHLSFAPPLQASDLEPLAGLPNNKFNKQVASLMDKQIRRLYRLTCNNYIAHDLCNGNSSSSIHYTNVEKEAFLQHYQQQLKSVEVEDPALLGDIFLGIYAHPVDAYKELTP